MDEKMQSNYVKVKEGEAYKYNRDYIEAFYKVRDLEPVRDREDGRLYYTLYQMSGTTRNFIFETFRPYDPAEAPERVRIIEVSERPFGLDKEEQLIKDFGDDYF